MCDERTLAKMKDVALKFLWFLSGFFVKMVRQTKPIEPDIYQTGREGKMFSVKTSLSPNEERPGRAGQEAQAMTMRPFSDYSVYKLYIGEAGNGNVYANISVDDMASLIKDADVAEGMHIKMKLLPKKSNGSKSSPAYTTRLNSRVPEYAKKTPAEIYLADPEGGMEYLQKQKAFLEQHLTGNYAKLNQSQIDAINDLIRIAQSGSVDASSAVPKLMLYSTPFKGSGRKVRAEDGKSFCYQIDISWLPGETSPVAIKIANCYCMIGKDNLPDLQTAADKKEKTFNLTQKEWDALVNAVKLDEIAFAGCYGGQKHIMRLKQESDRRDKFGKK